MRDQLNDIGEVRRVVAIVGRLGVFPPVKLALPGRRILAYLALHGQPVTRSVAAAKLWPDVADETGRANAPSIRIEVGRSLAQWCSASKGAMAY